MVQVPKQSNLYSFFIFFQSIARINPKNITTPTAVIIIILIEVTNLSKLNISII